MTPFNKITQNFNQSDVIISIILIIIIFIDLKPNTSLAIIIDENILAQIFIYCIALYTFIKFHPIVGVLSLFAANEIIKRSKSSTGGQAAFKYLPSQNKINDTLTSLNQHDVTLEEEIVSTMAPLVIDGPTSPPSYEPILESTNATLLTDL